MYSITTAQAALETFQFDSIGIASLVPKVLLFTGSLLTFVIPAKRLFPRTSIFISSLIYFAGVTSVVSVLVSFNASLAKPFIFLIIFVNIVISAYPSNWQFLVFSQDQFRSFSVAGLQFLSVLVALLIPLVKRLLGFRDGNILINSHEIYFSGISLEIMNANYSSRLRIIDSYPAEWSTYGFFSGSANAIPLIFLENLNVIDVMIAKLVLIAILLWIIIRQIPHYLRTSVPFLLSALLIFVGHFQFAFMSYHVFTILFLIINIVAFKKHPFLESVSLSLLIALSHPRAIFVGLGFILFHSITFFKNRDVKFVQSQIKCLFLSSPYFGISLILMILSLASTYLSGVSSAEQPAISISGIRNLITSQGPLEIIENSLASWFSPSWQLPFALGTHVESYFPSFEPVNDLSYHIIVYVAYFSLLIIACFSKIRQSIPGSNHRHILTLYASILLLIALFLHANYFLLRDSTELIFLREFCLFTIVPVISILLFVDEQTRDIIRILLLATLLPCLFTNAGIWAPMFMCLEIISFLFLWRFFCIQHSCFRSRLSISLLGSFTLTIVLLQFVNFIGLLDANSRDVYSHEIEISNLPNISTIACSTIDDNVLMGLSFMGIRVAYDAARPENYVVSRRFAISNSSLNQKCDR